MLRFTALVKGTSLNTIADACKRLPKGTRVEINKVTPPGRWKSDTILYIEGTDTELEQAMHNWFQADTRAPFEVGSLLHFSYLDKPRPWESSAAGVVA